MTIERIIVIMEHRLNTLTVRQAAAVQSGDLEEAVTIGGEIEETQETLSQLRAVL